MTYQLGLVVTQIRSSRLTLLIAFKSSTNCRNSLYSCTGKVNIIFLNLCRTVQAQSTNIIIILNPQYIVYNQSYYCIIEPKNCFGIKEERQWRIKQQYNITNRLTGNNLLKYKTPFTFTRKSLEIQETDKFLQRCEMYQDINYSSSSYVQLQQQVPVLSKLCVVSYQYFFYILRSVKKLKKVDGQK
ncbi:Hypothetical_protein [Hexamita inflata]|uniref:Hypothetical_protein n=1 Tax=Hexamita inflata TaxID=28002 RepID=A0ABP1HGB9_9EUKA